MPQMSPMNWTLLLVIFYMIFGFLCSKVHFFLKKFSISVMSKTQKEKKTFKFEF